MSHFLIRESGERNQRKIHVNIRLSKKKILSFGLNHICKSKRTKPMKSETEKEAKIL